MVMPYSVKSMFPKMAKFSEVDLIMIPIIFDEDEEVLFEKCCNPYVSAVTNHKEQDGIPPIQ